MERVRILLRTRNDAYPSPRSLSIPSTPSGPAPGKQIRCEVCAGRGRIRSTTVCPACNGRGKLAFDPYTGRVSDERDRKPAPMAPERVESEIQRLSTSLRLSAGEIDPNESYGWERAVERRNRQGSYRELERALERLRDYDPMAWEYILWFYTPTVEACPGPREEDVIALLASWLPEKIRLPRHLAVELRERKESLVLALLDEGLDEAEIADAALLSVSSVRKILDNHRGAKKSQSTATISS